MVYAFFIQIPLDPIWFPVAASPVHTGRLHPCYTRRELTILISPTNWQIPEKLIESIFQSIILVQDII